MPKVTQGAYDPKLQMFREEHIPDLRRLRFYRWLAEHGLLEHPVQGEVSGEFCEPATTAERTAYS